MSSISQFQPYNTVISSVTLGFPTTIVTTVDHNYHTGLIIRIFMPYKDGLQNMVNQLFPITVINSNSFTIPFDSRGENAFSVDPTAFQNAQIIPVAEQNAFLNSATDNVLL